jgi:hypothetical protein
MNDKPCPRCPSGGGEALAPERVAELVAAIPIASALRAPQPEYERRLAVCGACEALREATLCAYCGCLVLFRARPSTSYCPHPTGDKWIDDHKK